MKTWTRSSALLLTLLLLLAACGGTAPAAPSADSSAATQAAAAPQATSVPAATVAATQAAATSDEATSDEAITLRLFHWIGNDAGPVIEEINERFTAENPNITIEFESLQTDQYETVIKTRLAAGDAPDLFGVFPGTKKDPFVTAGYLLDLSNEPWVDRVAPGALSVASYQDAVYALPLDQNAIGVVYNKQIFEDLGLEVPTTWEQFLAVCEQIRPSGVTPLALGNKDLWVTQMVPFAMAPSAIYRDNPDFDQQMASNEVSFATSEEWRQMMADYVALEEQGYFNEDSLGTTYDQTTQLVAGGEAAMVINGNWIVAPLKEANPDIDLGMFPLPYAADGEEVWVSSAVGAMTAISATTEHPEAAKQYLEFWARPDIMSLYLTEKKAYPTLNDVEVELDPTAAEMLPHLQVGTYNFLDQKWPTGVQDQMFESIQGVFAGTSTIDEMLQNMDTVYQENAGS